LSRWSDVRDHAEINLDGTSGRQRVPKQAFDDLILTLPPLSEQTAIVSVLSSLDNKIDLLHRQNATLEKMAETLFRQWFVEEAKEEWEEKSLLDVIELVGGGTPKTSIPEYWDGNIKWVTGGDIASSHKNFVATSEKSITELGLQNSSTKLLPKFSTVISARGTVGKYCLLSESMAFSQSNYGIKPKYYNCYFFTYLLLGYSVEELQAAAYGSVFDTITTNTFKEHSIKLPDEANIKQFEKSISPYFQKMFSNTTQIRTLTQLRDTLLPKLMSGDVKINDVSN
jgi:type I restriction enzyme S subunit